MVLSKRERMLAIVAGAAVAVLLAYWLGGRFVWTPLMQARDEKLQLQADLEQARGLLANKERAEAKWNTMMPGGLRSGEEAESRVARALDEWSADARLTLSSVRPDRVPSDKGLKEITFVIAGTGSLEAVTWFLYQIETAELPVKVRSMTLGSRNDSGDTMSLELVLSALYLATDEESSSTQTQPKRQGTNDEEQLLL
jgi:hypothetical protein